MNPTQLLHRIGRGIFGVTGAIGVLSFGAWLGGAMQPARAVGGPGVRMPRATEDETRGYPNKSKQPPLSPSGQRALPDPTADTGAEIPLGDVLAVNGQPMQLSIFSTKDTPEQVISYYSDAFIKRGLRPVSHSAPDSGHISVFSPQDGMQRFINALPQADGETLVMVGITNPRNLPKLFDGAKTAPFPVPYENRGFLGYASEDAGARAQSGQFVTKLSPDEVLAYYRKELLPAGFHEQANGTAALAIFTHGQISISLAAQALEDKGGAAVFVNRIEGAAE